MPKVSSKSRGAKKTITVGLYLFGPGFSLFMLSQCPARVSLFVFCAPIFTDHVICGVCVFPTAQPLRDLGSSSPHRKNRSWRSWC